MDHDGVSLETTERIARTIFARETMHRARNDLLDLDVICNDRGITHSGWSFERYFDLAHAKEENKGSVARAALSLVSVDYVRTSCDIVVPRTTRIERSNESRSLDGNKNHESN